MRLPLTQTRDPDIQVRTMASAFLLLLWSSVASASPAEPFDAFVARFDKLWTPGSAEYEARAAVYAANVAKIAAHNALHDAGLATYAQGVNEHSDLTFDEFRARFVGGYVRGSPGPTTVVDETAAPESVDWRTKNAVTPVKNQGSCGSCWTFSATGAMEGAYAIATGSLRSLSEQELVDCVSADKGCSGGAMQDAFAYVVANGGIDGEKDYPYVGAQYACWTNATKRDVAAMANYTNVPPNDEAQLAAHVALGPVSVAIEADQDGFQHYSSGVFAGPCGVNLDQGVLVVGYAADYWIVKNSWGASWGEAGYIRLKRGVNASGLCGVALDASRPLAAAGPPAPVPPPTPGHPPSSNLPCNCTATCESTCSQFGLVCCGDGNNCDCSNLSACPKCDPTALPWL